MERKKQELTNGDVNRYFFRLVKSFNTPEKPQTFDVRTLRPGLSDTQVAEELAEFFNRISAEFNALKEEELPTTYDRSFPVMRPHEVSSHIKHFRKPKSMVKGDVFPAVLTKYCNFLRSPSPIFTPKLWHLACGPPPGKWNMSRLFLKTVARSRLVT